MGSIDPPELSLDFRRTAPVTEVGGEKERAWVPRTISDFIGEVSGAGAGGVLEKLSKVEDYVVRLDEEMRKIDAFKRELPLCMLLLNDAIRTLKDESMRYKNTVNAEPVLEEFIPIKKDDDGGKKEKLTVDVEINKDCKDKMSWMSSVQLWSSENPSPKPDFQFKIGESSKSEFNRKRVVDEEVKGDFFKSCTTQAQARAFVPFSGFELPGVPRLSLNPLVGKNPMEDLDVVCGNLESKVGSSSVRGVSCSVPSVQTDIRALSQQQQQSNSRKQRRCWSPELHRRFVDALQRLGGCQVATPKQIRELMQVDGLTNDEVKSHLQKYRLHMRKLPSTRNAANNQSLMVLGGLWMSQEHHGESSKQSNSQSGSPQCPLQLGAGASMGTSMTGGDSGGDSMEDGEDEKSESHSWKNHTILAS